MKIHHVTIPAHDPPRVATFLAELLGGRVIPLPHPTGTLLVYAGDDDGSALEIWPAASRINAGGDDLELRPEFPLPEAWPHHAYITSDACDPDEALALFAREGWWAEKVQNGPPGAGFTLVRGRIENHAAIELGGREMRAEYERFFQRVVGAA